MDALLRAAPLPVVALDPEGNVRFWNDAAERTFGWAEEEVLGRPVPFVPDDEGDSFRANLRDVLAGAPPRGAVLTRRRKDGTPVRIALWAAPVVGPDGRPIGGVGIMQDRTEQEAMQELLRRSESRARTLFDEAADALLLHEMDGRIIEANREACEGLGYSHDEMVGMQLSDFVVDPGPKSKTTRLRHLQPGDRLRGISAHHRRRDGSLFPVEVEIAVVEWDGRPLALATCRNVEERVRLEEELRQSQKMKAVGQLAGGVAHDFNNHLTTILTLARLHLEEGDLPPGVRDDLDTIFNAARHSAELTRQLLAFSRRQVLRPRVFGLDDAVRSLEQMLRRVLPSSLELVLDLGEDPGHVSADPAQLHQVLMNLVINARDAMPDGGRLTVRTRAADGRAAGTSLPDAEHGWVTLTVEDTGIGMEPEVLDRIFEPFFTTRQTGGGTGLGLPTVLGIVEQSGGRVLAESRPGKGSRFTVWLPRAQRNAAEAPATDAAGVAAGAARPAAGTILVVEDEADVRAVTRRILERAGWTVLEAANGLEARHLLRERGVAINVVLSDVVMPGEGGIALARQIRRTRPRLPVVLMSGYARDIAENAADLGRIVLLEKPFETEELLRAVEDALLEG